MNILTHPIDYQCPIALFSLFEAQKGAMLLHSGMINKDFGRYSYIMEDPFHWFSIKNEPHRNIAAELKEWVEKYEQPLLPGLPPFQGGLVGAFAYEFSQYIEPIKMKTVDDVLTPDIAVGIYDVVISFDHMEKKAWIISTGFPEREEKARQARANMRLQACLERLSGVRQAPVVSFHGEKAFKQISNFTELTYEVAVKKGIEYILAGDVFEVNLSQRFETELPVHFSSYDFYRKLCQVSPAPFSAYLNLGDMQIISSSPERFIKLSQRRVEARPIKGTIKRGKTEEEDRALAQALKDSEKDNAENVMIVDLLRNDLSKVCEDHSVNVSQLCGIETYANVHHLVSVIEGQLMSDYNAIDLFWALFPGGSITGAPKIRAMEIIAEIEKIHRGIYCGAIGYMGFNGEMDTSIAIRTATVKHHHMYYQAGGAVVADSDPHSEYEETLTKSSAFRNVLSCINK